MNLFIDGDAFPNLLKQIVFKAIKRLKINTIVIANKTINIGQSQYIEYMVVSQGTDEADDKIVEMSQENDLVITADIPLADRLISNNVSAIDHRGELYTKENIKQYLAMRNLMESIRDSGEITKGVAPFGKKDVHNFSNQFDSFLTAHF